MLWESVDFDRLLEVHDTSVYSNTLRAPLGDRTYENEQPLLVRTARQLHGHNDRAATILNVWSSNVWVRGRADGLRQEMFIMPSPLMPRRTRRTSNCIMVV